MGPLLTVGELVSRNAALYPDRIGTRDLVRAMTFRQWNERACRLANALLGLGLCKGDRVGILAYNCVEWMEIYTATAKAGLVAVPINFRLVGAEIGFIAGNAGISAFIVQHDFVEVVDSIRAEQLTKLGSIGREITGSGRIQLIAEDGREVAGGEPGELYSRTAYAFQEYWKLPDKTAEAFRGHYCTVNDIARRDEDGYYYLVDRKKNMIISGGENIYPSEVEGLLGTHPKVKDVAVIGIPHEKWGESVHAVIILHQQDSATEREILDWCGGRIAGYKRPRSVSIVEEKDMPRTATGKILHRVLRDRHSATRYL